MAQSASLRFFCSHADCVLIRLRIGMSLRMSDYRSQVNLVVIPPTLW